MSILRMLLWFFIGWLIYRFIRQSLPSNKPTNTHSATKPTQAIEQMVRCQVCDLHVPQTEAIEDHGRYYCSEDHRRRDQQAS